MAEGKEEQGKIDFHHPYTPYDIQETFMNTVYEVIEKGGVGILESPTGTVCLLFMILIFFFFVVCVFWDTYMQKLIPL